MKSQGEKFGYFSSSFITQTIVKIAVVIQVSSSPISSSTSSPSSPPIQVTILNMRLINTQTYELVEFFYDIPPYAILSHAWGNEEVTFQEYLLVAGPEASRHAHIRRKGGFSKIMGACHRARGDGLKFLWCDTNCIDKSSSAELTEAINSMYAWYRDSVVCYAFLADVDASPGAFAKSRWFTRGWTLQELLAPKKVVFFDGHWGVLREKRDLADTISKITRIHIGALHDCSSIPEYSIAQRMSWAASRQTSRSEDIAYCLLGIFGINMPLLYGEGSKAFMRLQAEIIKVTDDQSILAWGTQVSSKQPPTGALALSPASFSSCGSIVKEKEAAQWPYSITNLGISLQLPIIQTRTHGTMLAGLNCSYELQEVSDPGRHHVSPHTRSRRLPIWIWLMTTGTETFVRTQFPTPRTFLGELYPERARRTIVKLYIKTGIPVFPKYPDIANSTLSNKHETGFPTGFVIALSFGQLRHLTGTFEAAFPPGNFTIDRIKFNQPLNLTHEVILMDNYGVLLSMVWDQHGCPKSWRHLVFANPNRQISDKMKVDNWAYLSGRQYEKDGSAIISSNGVENIDNLMKRLPECHLDRSDIKQRPYVYMGKDVWINSYGQPKVFVHVVFQENPIITAIST
ncbi:HET-domain-containing protein [Nemania diffusa]|nr:HET-domain-containing protein [Nemania diffusa]